MKKLFLFSLVFLVVGCEYQAHEPEARFGNATNDIFVVNVKGHDYVIYDGYNKGGIVHAESCPCKSSNE